MKIIENITMELNPTVRGTEWSGWARDRGGELVGLCCWALELWRLVVPRDGLSFVMVLVGVCWQWSLLAAAHHTIAMAPLDPLGLAWI